MPGLDSRRIGAVLRNGHRLISSARVSAYKVTFRVLAGCLLVLYTAAEVRAEDDAGSRSLRERMVRTQLSGPYRTAITSKPVLDAMLAIPRHEFIPPAGRKLAYEDTPVPIGYGQTISQPYIVALMTQALELKKGMKVLEVGTGSGYQAAVLAEITPEVYTIEIVQPLYNTAESTLRRLGYKDVVVKHGDGYHGIKEAAPFDAIIVTCAALHVPPPLLEQLAPGGRMAIPVGGMFETQRLLLVTKDDAGKRTSTTLELVRFVPLVRSSGASP